MLSKQPKHRKLARSLPGLQICIVLCSLLLSPAFAAPLGTNSPVLAALVPTLPAQANLAPSPQPLSVFLLTVQLGGNEAYATDKLIRSTNEIISRELNCSKDACHVSEAWNVSKCVDGAPAPAPSQSIFVSPQDGEELSYSYTEYPSDLANGQPSISAPPYSSQIFSSGSLDATGRRLQADEGVEEVSVPTLSTRPCVPQADIVLSMELIDSEKKVNETAIFFINGGFLANMQASGIEIEQATLLDFDELGQSHPPADPNNDPSLYTFTPEPGQLGPNFTSPEFSLNLVGDNALVTNDTVLRALYELLTDRMYNGVAAKWLYPDNTAIVDIKQGKPQNINGTIGRRLLHRGSSTTLLSPHRRGLTQSNLPAPLSSDGAFYGANSNTGQMPSLDIIIKVQQVPTQDTMALKNAVGGLFTGNVLLAGFHDRDIGIYKVTLTSFSFQSGSTTRNQDASPPSLETSQSPAPSTTDLIYPDHKGSGNKAVVISTAVVVPVVAVSIIVTVLALLWYQRQRRLGSSKVDSSQAWRHSKSSSDSLESKRLKMSVEEDGEIASIMSAAHPPNLSQSRLMDMPWNDWKIDPSELTILTKPDQSTWLLGTGASGTVYKALRNGVQIVAVKMFRDEVTRGAISSLNSWSHALQFRQEISILKNCHDRNIVQFIGACLTEGQTALVTEFLENGDLHRAINSQQGLRYHWYRMHTPDGKPIPNSGMAKRIALDVARGLHFLHCKKIVHFDLKSANILLARDFTAKIADVGLAKVLHDDVLSTRREVGTFAWAAPEVLLGQRTTEKADIYSFGVLLHELSAVESPRDRQLRRLKVPEEAPPEIDELIHRCLDLNPQERPTARELVATLSCIQALTKP